jgi:hypothetical protein
MILYFSNLMVLKRKQHFRFCQKQTDKQGYSQNREEIS